MSALEVDALTVQSGRARLVDGVSFRVGPGEMVVLLGPNGAGKSTLIRACLGLSRPLSGTARLEGVDIARMPPAERARRVSYLPQIRPLAWPARVRDVVALGRFAHGAAPGRLRGADGEAVAQALETCGLLHLAERTMDTLSGGEIAMVHCARAMAARAALLIADEPVAALDLRHQFLVLDRIAQTVQQGGGALIVLHDVGMAARYATRLIWMKAGRKLADGAVEETLTPQRIAEVYGVHAQVDGRAVTLVGTAQEVGADDDCVT